MSTEQKASVRREILTMSAALPGPDNPLPIFRDPAWDRTVRLVEPIQESLKDGTGRGAGYRILPYGRQDNYTRQRQPHGFQSIVLENHWLKAVFLPELGARLISLYDKVNERELLYRNPCIQVANLAIRNAWFSGGIEWNIGQLGHSYSTCAPVFAGKIMADDGSESLRIWDYERMKGLFWQIDFQLSTTEPVLLAHTRIINPDKAPAAMYWWTNIAVPETTACRVLAPTDTVLCLMPAKDGIHTFAEATLPGLPSIKGADGSYPANFPFANEFFFMCKHEAQPWEAIVDQAGVGFFELSTRRLAYRKLFVWGTHSGGRHWQEFLAPEGGGNYVEIQAGLAPTQLHGLDMPGQTVWTWTEAFGALQTDAKAVHDPDWQRARQAAELAIRGIMPPPNLEKAAATASFLAALPVAEFLCKGSDFACLERERLAKSRPTNPEIRSALDSMAFPPISADSPAWPWQSLLNTGILPEMGPGQAPDTWMTHTRWMALLQQSLRQAAGQNSHSWLHYGVMALEAGESALAATAWTSSWQCRPNVLAARNLAVLALREKRLVDAQAFYDQALQVARTKPGLELAREYLDFLAQDGSPDARAKARNWLPTLPAEFHNDDRIRLPLIKLAMADGDWDTALALMDHEFPTIREGEVALSDIWIRAQAGKLAAQRQSAIDEALLAESERLFPVPHHLDFRLFVSTE